MKRLKNFGGLGAVLGALLLVYSLLPLGTAMQFGGDEGYELITGFLMSKGYVLYQQIWNDQPPLLVLMLKWVFQAWGSSILAARLMAAGFGLLLFGTFFELTNSRIGRPAALLATFFLLSSPAILELSVSVMQEAPAFALALVSLLLLFQWIKSPRWGWLLASGAAMGLALEIKLTAALVLPAMLTEIFLALNGNLQRASLKKIARATLLWSLATGIVFMAITLVWGQGSFESSYRSHFGGRAVFGLPRPEHFTLPLSLFWDHVECVVAAATGLVLVIQRRKWRVFAFPLVMLMTVLAVHAVHRPWWMCYYLHIAIPLCWLAGFAANEAITHTFNLLTKSRFDFASKKTWQGIGLCALVALVLERSENRLEGGVKLLQERPRIKTDPIVNKMKENASHTHWVYVQDGKEIYPFQAQLPMPPELAVVSLKRYWSGQISNEEIVAACKRYQVEQVLLDPSQIGEAWKDFLTNYDVSYQDMNNVLYIAKQVEH
jgi:4-amino-4-deoxy-L-arabinose transferase-like glycosyltransferase